MAQLPAAAADRQVTPLPDTDLPGFDYAIDKGVTLEACEASCVADRVCRAFTYNEAAGWCFRKGRAGEPAPFAGASSGTISSRPTPEELARQRETELPFPAIGLVASARYFATNLPKTDPPPPGLAYADLVAAGDAAVAQANPAAAMVSYRQALAIVDGDPDLWLALARAALARAAGDATTDNDRYDLGTTATYAALMAYLQAGPEAEQAAALAVLAQGLELRAMWREAIASYRASLALVEDAALQARLDTAVAEHGFRVVAHHVDADSATPRICAEFSAALPAGAVQLSDFVAVRGDPQLAVEREQSQLCLEGVEHGRRYQLTLRAGLPSADGERLLEDVELDVYVPDRAPFVGFANSAYVMPARLGGGLPITSVNAELAEVVIYRIGDRSIATAVRNGMFQQALDGYSAEDIADRFGELVWEGELELAPGAPNAMTTTAIPVAEVLTEMAPGAYVITARIAGVEQDYWRSVATQWFIITDLGLTALAGEDGMHGFLRSLTSAEPVAGATVRLVAVNNEVLGETTTDAAGRADFAPGLARGSGGRAPQLLVAETAAGDYAFLDLSDPAFDLTDRGVEGRPAPGPLDLFATTERGVYRPGETVFLTALLRDSKANAVTDLPLTLLVVRPDGVTAERRLLQDGGAGGYHTSLPLPADAMRGSWTLRLHADPEAEMLGSATFLVEDFEPERLAFEVSAERAALEIGEATPVAVLARYLYGATAPDLAIEADVVLRPVTTLGGYPGYIFGRHDDTLETTRQPLGTVSRTDEQGAATAEIVLPQSLATTRPLQAQIILRLVDTSGRPVERSLIRPVASGPHLGIRPQFDADEGPAEGTTAAFDLVAVGRDGAQLGGEAVSWVLSRVETEYQWYNDGSGWKWEPITTSRRIADGVVDTVADGPVTVAAPVGWGRYRLEVESSGPEATASSYEFYAGYYYGEAGSETPDTLEVALDKPAYRAGDTAVLRLVPQFAGTALVAVMDDGIIDMMAVAVPAEGIAVDLPVTEEWGPGAYVTATLYRPASAPEKRMPARALGLAYAPVEPGDRRLEVDLTLPAETLPRQSVTARVEVANLPADAEAYVAVAAVDLGILNLTGFAVPDPDGWYFGQRQLGVEIRDLYGQLIDPMQGQPGRLRSGGDGAAARLGTPPPTSVLVALHSGIVALAEDGTASVSFDLPDFAGTVRIMAMAWTADAVGHDAADLVVRDPVVVTLSPPRFLRVDDRSRLLVEVNNVAGAAGRYVVDLTGAPGIEIGTSTRSVELAEGARAALEFDLMGRAPGDYVLQLVVRGPDGATFEKQQPLGVRAASTTITTSRRVPIAAGETVTLDASYFAGLLPNSGALSLALGPVARLDVPGLLLRLDRYPYGCAEQVASRALPLLYLNEVAQTLGLGADEAIAQRVREAIADLLNKQTSGGGFGLWGPFSGTDMWLDAYVTDFLLRARDQGYEVPDRVLSMALDNLANQVAYAPDFSHGGEDLAYALYDLARAGRAAIGDLRYYTEARLDAFATPLAKAQLGAALALYGDQTRASAAFQAALDAVDASGTADRRSYRADYGSQLRDLAGVLALAAEFDPAGVDPAALADDLAARRDTARYTSTQEDAWTLLAAAALMRDAADGSFRIDGVELTGAVYRRFDQELLEAGAVAVTNAGDQASEATVTVTGIPLEPPAASETGFEISRAYFRPDGTPFDPELSLVAQNDRFVVALTIVPETLGSGQYLVVDPLPGGFEIENPNLSAAAGVADLAWLGVNSPVHVESRTDRYVAAFRYTSDVPAFSTAYLVRAVTPGLFALPGATVEDMYRPELRGNTAAGSVEVSAAGGGDAAAAAAPGKADQCADCRG